MSYYREQNLGPLEAIINSIKFMCDWLKITGESRRPKIGGNNLTTIKMWVNSDI